MVPRYDSLTGENFRVTFLGHESQHFADIRRFGQLAPWRLEYRATLVELAYADATRRRILDRFVSSQGTDAADAHSFANRRVLDTLVQRLSVADAAALADVPAAQLRAAAVAALRADTLALRAGVDAAR